MSSSPPDDAAADDAADDADLDGTDTAQLPDFVSFLPDQIWYLTESGSEMWCRRPYGFFFTSSSAAADFALAMGTQFALTPIGFASKELVSKDGIEGVRHLGLTRLFIDPQIDPASGEVFGKILRLTPIN